jgi:diacylglycerol kinase family enzyme
VPVPVQLDGEPGGFTPVEIEVLPAALTVVMV